MCTAITFHTKDFYFGRTLDLDCSFAEEVTVAPRSFPLPFRHRETAHSHYAIIGMAHVAEGYPLYYDGVNEKGLAMAGLNFPEFARYAPVAPGRENIASFELIPRILGCCASVAEAEAAIAGLNITGTPFSPQLPPTPIHWLIADRHRAVTLEATATGLQLHDNPVGVLTNSPPFEYQMLHLRSFLHLSPEEPENRFSADAALTPFSRGMGAMGLPGDLSSTSRFVRAAFSKLNSVSGMTEEESVSQFFHILDTVAQTRGCCRLKGGRLEQTVYTSCCNADKGIYYYTTYSNRRITGVHLHREALDGEALVRCPLKQGQDIALQKG